MSLNPVIAEVTARIVERSKDNPPARSAGGLSALRECHAQRPDNASGLSALREYHAQRPFPETTALVATQSIAKLQPEAKLHGLYSV